MGRSRLIAHLVVDGEEWECIHESIDKGISGTEYSQRKM